MYSSQGIFHFSVLSYIYLLLASVKVWRFAIYLQTPELWVHGKEHDWSILRPVICRRAIKNVEGIATFTVALTMVMLLCWLLIISGVYARRAQRIKRKKRRSYLSSKSLGVTYECLGH